MSITDHSTPIHKTNILPLRWFANFCNHIGTPYIVKLFDLQEKDITSGFRWKLYNLIWNSTWAIYMRWGTSYKLDMDAWRKDVWGENMWGEDEL